MNSTEIPHPDYKHLIGKKVTISIDNNIYYPDILYFIGKNRMGHDVITLKNSRSIHYIKDWTKIKIHETKKNDTST